MRKKLSLLLLLLLIPTLAYAWGVMIIGGGVPAAGGGTPGDCVSWGAAVEEQTDTSKDHTVGHDNSLYNATSFTTTGARSIGKMELYTSYIGSGYGVTGYIADDNAGDPGNDVSGGGVAVALGSVQNGGWTSFVFTSYIALSNATTYWVVLYCGAGGGPCANCIKWHAEDAANGDHDYDSDWAGAWTDYDTRMGAFKLYECQD